MPQPDQFLCVLFEGIAPWGLNCALYILLDLATVLGSRLESA